MGSKMSFSRASSDQNTASDLTSVASRPRDSIHAPLDGKQTPEHKIGCEEDLDSKWGEEMKAGELTQPQSESRSSAHVESNGRADSQTLGGKDCQRGEHTPLQAAMEGKSQPPAIVCSSTTDNHGHPVEVRRKPGRPRKIKAPLTEGKNHLALAVYDAVQHKAISTSIPLPSDGPLINNSPHNEMPGLHIVSDGNVQDSVPVLTKRKRGRPRKKENVVFETRVVKASAAAEAPAASVNNATGLAGRLRSRGELHPLTEEEKPESERSADAKPTEVTPTEQSNTLVLHGIKRRSKQADQQVPAKVCRLEVSQKTSSMLIINTRCGEGARTDKQVEQSAYKQETETDGKTGHLHQQEEQTKSMEGASPQGCSQPAEPIVISLNSLNLITPTHCDDPMNIKKSDEMNGSAESQSKSDLGSSKGLQNSESSSTGVVMASKEAAFSVPPAVKAESIQIVLDHLNPSSESSKPKSLQRIANTTVAAQGPDRAFRRKRGGKRRRRRRRRISNVLSQREQPGEAREGSEDAQQNTDYEAANSNVSHVKRGGESLLKCGFCGQTFKFLSQFIIHQRVHTGERPFKCPQCDKGFSKNSNLNLHLKTHKKCKVYQKCPFCKIKFSCSEYSSHMKMHPQMLDQDTENNTADKPSMRKDYGDNEGLRSPVSLEKRENKVCQYCGKTFQFLSALVRHVRVHTGEKPYKCDICGKAFGQAYFLRVHELTHWSVKRFNCTRCEKAFTHYSNAKNHRCHPSKSSEDDPANRRLKPSLTYTCHICKNVFDHLQEFNSHMRDHTGAKLYRCLYCDKLFGVLSEFVAHRGRCRGDSSVPGAAKETMSLIEYTVPSLRCGSSGPGPAASLTGANRTEARQTAPQAAPRKRSAAASKKPFQTTAGHPSPLVSKLNRLDNRSDPKKYLCPSCGRLFRHMGRLRAHMLTHAARQSYTCACCGKTLESWRKLWHHQRVHRQRRGRFTCPQCGQGFRFVHSYKKHMRKHPEFQWVEVRPKKALLPYQCEQCRCSFKTLDLLFSHQLCHSSTHKGSEFDLSVDDHTEMLFHAATLHSDPVENHNCSLGPLPECPDGSTQVSPQALAVKSNGPDSDKTSTRPSGTQSIQDGQADCDKMDDNAFGKKTICPSRTVKRPFSQKLSVPNEASADGVRCAVCGDKYAVISDLYHHYLKHARGQL